MDRLREKTLRYKVEDNQGEGRESDVLSQTFGGGGSDVKALGNRPQPAGRVRRRRRRGAREGSQGVYGPPPPRHSPQAGGLPERGRGHRKKTKAKKAQ